MMDLKRYIQPGKGASDITPLFLDPKAFSALIDRFADVFEKEEIDKIACIEARGFILGAALAYKLKKGLVLLRKKGMLKNKSFFESFKDYSGKEKGLELQVGAVLQGERVLIVDDWVETGGAVCAAIKLIEKAKGIVVGIATFMDDSSEEIKNELNRYNYHYLEKVLSGDKF